MNSDVDNVAAHVGRGQGILLWYCDNEATARSSHGSGIKHRDRKATEVGHVEREHARDAVSFEIPRKHSQDHDVRLDESSLTRMGRSIRVAPVRDRVEAACGQPVSVTDAVQGIG
jgi:hypothetical protein